MKQKIQWTTYEKQIKSYLLLVQVCFIYSTCVLLLLRIHYPGLQCALNYSTSYTEGPREAICIATCYWLDGPGIESQRRQDYLHLSRPHLGPACPLYNEQSTRDVVSTAHHDLALRLKKAYSNSSTPSLNLLQWTLPFTFNITYWKISTICSSWHTRLQMLYSVIQYTDFTKTFFPFKMSYNSTVHAYM